MNNRVIGKLKTEQKAALIVILMTFTIGMILYAGGHKVRLRTLQGSVISNPICIRATENLLHSDGNGGKFGQVGTSGQLHSGDAFICDVDGDNAFNTTTEMFYYVSDYYDTTSKSFNSDYAVLIYYNNVSSGSPNSTATTNYDLEGSWYGPRNAIKQLPTEKMWPNVRLYKPKRKIVNFQGESTISVYYNNNSTTRDLPTAFSYDGYTSRFLTLQEAKSACGNSSTYADCQFLLENTWSTSTSGKAYYLETPWSGSGGTDKGCAWATVNYQGGMYYTCSMGTSTNSTTGVRPVIEVKKTDMNLNTRTGSTRKITFNPNISGISSYSQNIDDNIPEPLATNTFTRSGYRFLGWNTKADGSGTMYKNKANITVNSDITLYAQWISTSTPRCRRAKESELHSAGSGKTYGNVGVSGQLNPGDAFLCDVNGDGNYNLVTETFYYVSDYYNTSQKTFDSSYATLIYYNNVYNGEPSNTTKYAYHASNNYNGPKEAMKQLPTAGQWINVDLKTNYRNILNDEATGTTPGGNLPTNFSYAKYGARLLTYQELMQGCPSAKNQTGSLNSCLFLLENGYTSATPSYANGYWLETAYSGYTDRARTVFIGNQYAGNSLAGASVSETASLGVRPAIDVKKSEMNLNVVPTCSDHEQLNSSETACECVSGYSKVNGVCTKDCGTNEQPNSTNTACECKSGYTKVNGVCTLSCGTNEQINEAGTACECKYGYKKQSGSCVSEGIVCKSARSLHSTYCSYRNSSTYAGKWCKGDGYTYNGYVQYGHNQLSSGNMTTGYALDCDVNGDGTFNSNTERFYYVSDYYDTKTKTFDTSVAALVSYSGFYNGSSNYTSNSHSAYYSSARESWHGPSSVLAKLPTTSQWSNVSLKTTNRSILSMNEAQNQSTSTILDSSSTTRNLPDSFSYSGRAARLLTYQELLRGCPSARNYSEDDMGEHSLKTCNFLFENTKYTYSSNATDMLWLENPVYSIHFDSSGNGKTVFALNVETSSIDGSYVDSSLGVHPVIDVPKNRIQLTSLPQCGEHEEVNSSDTACQCKEGYVRNSSGNCEAKAICSSNEEYVEDGNTCRCKSGYEEVNYTCVAVCGEHETRNSSGVCECDDQYERVDGVCERTSVGPPIMACDPNAHEKEATVTSLDQCECEDGYTRVDGVCTQSSIGPPPILCDESAHEVADYSTGSGQCVCENGYSRVNGVCTQVNLSSIQINDGNYPILDNGETVASLTQKTGISEIYRNSQVISGTTKLATGDTFTYNNSTYTIVIKGDVTGDGKVNAMDLLTMYRHMKNVSLLTGARKEAALPRSDGRINTTSMLNVYRIMKGQ